MDASAKTAEGERTAPADSPVSPRSVGRTDTLHAWLLAAATCSLIVLVVVGITGGFTLRAGPLYLSAHSPVAPLLIAIGAIASGLLRDRVAFLRIASTSWQFVDEHAPAMAVAIAAAAVGTGMASSTYSASSSDASGYVSESRLIASAQLATDEPLARTVAWPNATWAFSPLGYRPGSDPGELVPTYPAGLPLVIALVRTIGGELAAYLVVPFLGGLAVFVTWAVGARLHSRAAGLAAAVLLATSPIFLFQLVQPMSDVAVTAWWTVALLFALLPLPGAPIAAGAAAGFAFLTRPNLLPLGMVIALAVINWPRGRDERRRRTDRFTGLVAGFIPAMGAQLLMQWRLYGNPFASGYGATGDLFSVANIGPNASGYLGRMLHGESAALAIGLIAVVVLATAPRAATAPPSVKRPLVLAMAGALVLLASYLPYGVFAEWSYLRFLLPGFPLLFVLIGSLLVAAVLRVPPAVRTTLFVCLLAAAASMNVLRARAEQAFNMHRFESRYRLAGRYLASALPPNTVVVSVQESGGVRYYTGFPILRWDLVGVDLDTAMAALRAVGRHPVLLVEDWEAADLAKRHPSSVNARLDWMPRAEFGDEVRVLLYDPADRAAPHAWRADRVH